MNATSSSLQRLALAAALVTGLLTACGGDPGLRTTPTTTGGDPATTPGATPPATPAPPPATPPATPAEPPPPARVAVAQFSCLGMLAPAHVRQRVTGGLTAQGEPVDVSFILDATDAVLATGAAPTLDAAYDGGYWLSNYGLDAWRVATTAEADYALLLPSGPQAGPFTAMGITDYLGGGNYQDQLTCGTL